MLARAVSVQQAYGASYWHLLTEVAPRLLLALPLLRADPGCHVLMPATAASRQLLRMLHLDPRRIAEVPNPNPNPNHSPNPNPNPKSLQAYSLSLPDFNTLTLTLTPTPTLTLTLALV